MDIPFDTPGERTPPWIRLGWARLALMVANSQAPALVSEAQVQRMVHALFQTLRWHLAGSDNSADIQRCDLCVAGVDNLVMFHWLIGLLPDGFCQRAALDGQGSRHVGDAAVEALERSGQCLKSFYLVDLAPLREAPGSAESLAMAAPRYEDRALYWAGLASRHGLKQSPAWAGEPNPEPTALVGIACHVTHEFGEHGHATVHGADGVSIHRYSTYRLEVRQRSDDFRLVLVTQFHLTDGGTPPQHVMAPKDIKFNDQGGFDTKAAAIAQADAWMAGFERAHREAVESTHGCTDPDCGQAAPCSCAPAPATHFWPQSTSLS